MRSQGLRLLRMHVDPTHDDGRPFDRDPEEVSMNLKDLILVHLADTIRIVVDSGNSAAEDGDVLELLGRIDRVSDCMTLLSEDRLWVIRFKSTGRFLSRFSVSTDYLIDAVVFASSEEASNQLSRFKFGNPNFAFYENALVEKVSSDELEKEFVRYRDANFPPVS